MEELELLREDGMMFAASVLFPKWEMYTRHIPSVGKVDQCMQEIIHYERCKKEWSTLFPTIESVLPALETT